MSDDERELSGDEATRALMDFVHRGRRAQEAVDVITKPIGTIAAGFDRGASDDRTVWRCTCGFTAASSAEMLAHVCEMK